MKEQKNRMVNSWDYKQDPNYVPPDPEKAKLTLRLGEMITDRIAVKLTHTMTYDDPEYWMLDELFNKEEIQFMLSFKKTRVNVDLDELARRNNMTEEHARKVLDHIMWCGFIESNRDTPDHHKTYDVPIFVPGSAEFSMLQDKLVEEHPHLATFFNLMTQMPLENLTQMVPPGGAGIGMHVIPVEAEIKNNSEAVPIEKLSHWLDKYDKFAVGTCTCRRQQTMRGEGSGDIAGDYCIAVGDMAEWLVEDRKIGHYCSREHVNEVLDRAERHGYMHQITNIDGEDKIVGICNCASGVCNALRISELYNTPNMVRSAYRAHVDPEKCTACGKCAEVCPAGAAKIGQRLCTKHGPVQYPKALLPDETKWGADHWNIHYREDVQIQCYETGTAPCKAACPAHIAVQGYIQMAKEGRYEEALRLIRQDNPFPAVCGSICNRRCEDACTRGTIDEPLAIDEIKKFLAEQELDPHKRKEQIPFCEKADGGMWSDDYKIAIIGGGPAGLSAAYYLRLNGYPVTVFEREQYPGGMLINGIPSFRLSRDLIHAEIEILKDMGVEFKCGVNVGKDITLMDLHHEGYKAFYIAIGLQNGRKLNIPGEDAENVESGISFLRRINQDHNLTLTGDTVVIGGGNVAIDVARSALRITDGSVTMLCLEQRNEMPASDEEIAEAEKEGIQIQCGWGPKEILIKDNHVSGIIFKKCTSVKDEQGRFRPSYDEEDTITLTCDHILSAIGQSADWGDLLQGTKAVLRPNGTIETDPVTDQTKEPSIFAGGDIAHGAKFAIDAIADGRNAADSLNRFVHPGNSLTVGRNLRQFSQLNKDDILIDDYDHAGRNQHNTKKTSDHFDDTRLPFTIEQVEKEANRCLHCGLSVIDENHCIGCGICTTRCHFDAIHLKRDMPSASTMIKAEDKMKLIGPYAAKRAMKIAFKKR